MNKKKALIINICLISMAGIIFYFLIAPFYCILPLGKVNVLGQIYSSFGNIDCLAKMKLCTPCTFSGIPIGGYMPFGLSYVYIASIVKIISGLPVSDAYNLSGIIFLMAGWYGTFKIIRNLGGNLFFSFFGGLWFLLMPIVYAKTGYSFLMWAFASFPFYLWLDIWYFRTDKTYAGSAAILFSKIFLIFLEPYTFVMLSIFTCLLIFREYRKARKNRPVRSAAKLKIFVSVVSPLLAYIFYILYIPGNANYAVMSMDMFRGQGIDLLAFFNRADGLYAAGQFWNIKIPDPRAFYTDGESVYHVYFGIGLMLIIPLLIVFRKKIPSPGRILLGAGIITLVLSLGPSLKINDQRDMRHVNTKNFTGQDYEMPKASATLTMPWQSIYKISPVKYMRSVSRWYLPAVVTFIIILMVLLSFLWNYKRYGKYLALIAVIWISIEYAPDYQYRMKLKEDQTGKFRLFNSTALAEFEKSVKHDDIVLFLQEGGLQNEYFTTYLCSDASCSTYNISTDKAIDLSVRHWPKKIYDVAMKPDTGSVHDLLESKLATVIVIPHFDMRWDSYSWPPQKSTMVHLTGFAGQFKGNDPHFQYTGKEWFSYIRLKP